MECHHSHAQEPTLKIEKRVMGQMCLFQAFNNNNNNHNNTLFNLINVNIDTMNRRYQRLSLSSVSPFKLKQFKSIQLNKTQTKLNQMLVFEERGKPEYPEKNPSEQSREPTNSAHL